MFTVKFYPKCFFTQCFRSIFFTFVLGEGDVRLLLVGKHKRVSSILFLKTMVDKTGENMGVRIRKTKYTWIQ